LLFFIINLTLLLISTQTGVLFAHQKRMWVSQPGRKRTLPQEGDYVIGIIQEVLGECYSVDICGPRLATLELLAFDGASRRNCPNLARGSLVFARVLYASPDAEPVLTCMLSASQQHNKKDWTSGEALFGELKAGGVFSLSSVSLYLD
jgi:exosome complex component RRP40